MCAAALLRLLIAVLLSAAAPAVAETRCYRNVLGNLQCTEGGAPSFQLQQTIMPGVWRTYPAPGSSAPSCEIRKNFLGEIVTRCD